MRKCHLWGILNAVAFSLASGGAGAEDLIPGIVAVQGGSPFAPEPNGFKGTGFLIAGNWIITARHVVTRISDGFQRNQYFVTLGTRSDGENAIEVVDARCPDPSIDICFLKLNDASSELSGPLAVPFELMCENENDAVAIGKWVSIVGFANNSTEVYGPVSGQITNVSGFYSDDTSGISHENVVRTGLVTQPGLSGAPVMLKGTRTVVGVHTGLVGGVQVFAPLYLFDVAVKYRGKEIACGADRTKLPERTQSLVFQYTGSTFSQPEAEIRRLIFNGVSFIRSRVRDVPESESNFGYLNWLGAEIVGDFSSFGDLQEAWKQSDAALQVLYGEFRQTDTRDLPLEIESHIYIGNLPELARQSNLLNEFTVVSSNNVSEFRHTADGHHLVLIYALLLDAKRLNKPDHVVLGLLSVAEYVIDYLARNGLLVGDLRVVAQEIALIRSEYP